MVLLWELLYLLLLCPQNKDDGQQRTYDFLTEAVRAHGNVKKTRRRKDYYDSQCIKCFLPSSSSLNVPVPSTPSFQHEKERRSFDVLYNTKGKHYRRRRDVCGTTKLAFCSKKHALATNLDSVFINEKESLRKTLSLYYPPRRRHAAKRVISSLTPKKHCRNIAIRQSAANIDSSAGNTRSSNAIKAPMTIPVTIQYQKDETQFGRGASHLSALLEVDDIAVYVDGIWEVDGVVVGDDSLSPEIKFAKVDHTQIVWTHNCEHGYIRGDALFFTIDDDNDDLDVVDLTTQEVGGELIDFGPEQLLARISPSNAEHHGWWAAEENSLRVSINRQQFTEMMDILKKALNKDV